MVGSPVVAFLGCNTAKYAEPAVGNAAGGAGGGKEVWTILSTASFAKRFKVPQEHLEGTDTEREVTEKLLEAALPLWNAARSSSGSARDADSGSVVAAAGGGLHFGATKLQLWGAGVPLNVVELPSLPTTPP